MKSGFNFNLVDHTDECIAAKDDALERAVEKIGLAAEGYAIMKRPMLDAPGVFVLFVMLIFGNYTDIVQSVRTA